MNINYLWFFWIGMLFWSKLEVELKVIKKKMKIEKFKEI